MNHAYDLQWTPSDAVMTRDGGVTVDGAGVVI